MQGYRAWGFRGCSVVGIGFETWMEVFGTATASIGEESDELDWSTIKLAGRSGDSKHHRLPSVYFSPILNPRPQALKPRNCKAKMLILPLLLSGRPLRSCASVSVHLTRCLGLFEYSSQS